MVDKLWVVYRSGLVSTGILKETPKLFKIERSAGFSHYAVVRKDAQGNPMIGARTRLEACQRWRRECAETVARLEADWHRASANLINAAKLEDDERLLGEEATSG